MEDLRDGPNMSRPIESPTKSGSGVAKPLGISFRCSLLGARGMPLRRWSWTLLSRVIDATEVRGMPEGKTVLGL
eukprot:748683-Pyramimonas_sp.AAC.1